METEQLKATLPSRPSKREGMLVVEIPAEDFDKLNAYWNSDQFEAAEAFRDVTLNKCLKSIEIALNWATRHDCSGARVFATLLASLYNGQRVKLDVSDLALLDATNLEHALNTIRLCMETRQEPHTFFKDGGNIFEKMIADWRLEKKRRAK